jgi:hypothetical protein
MVLKEGSPHAYNIHILQHNFPWTTKLQMTQTQCAVNGPKGLKIHLQGAA